MSDILLYGLNDPVIVKHAWVQGETYFGVRGRIEGIHITKLGGIEYDVQLYYPDGASIRGVDVSGQEVVNIMRFKQNQLEHI